MSSIPERLYRRKIIEVCNHLDTNDVTKLKYLYATDINEDVNSLQLVALLEGRNILGFDKVDEFVELLNYLKKDHLIPKLKPVYLPPIEIVSQESKRFKHGCVLVFTINQKVDSVNVPEVSKVEYCYSDLYNANNDGNWLGIFLCPEEIEKDTINHCYFHFVVNQNRLYLKVENVFHKESVKFRIHFIDSNRKQFSICHKVNFKGYCDYELKFNELFVTLPEPILDNFSQNLRTSGSPGWRFKQCYPSLSDDIGLVSCAVGLIDRHYILQKGPICNFYVYTDTVLSNVVKKFKDLLDKYKYKDCLDNCNHISAILTYYPLNMHASLSDIPSFINHTMTDDSNRLMIYVSNINLIIFVFLNVLDSLETLSKICKNLLFDVTLYLNITMPLIKDEELNVIGIVASPLVDRREVKNKFKEQFSFQFTEKNNLDNIFFLFQNEITEQTDFENWWGNIIKHLCQKRKMQSLCNEKSLLFKQLIGANLLFMATHNIISLDS